MPPWFLYAAIFLCLYLGVVEPVLERVLKKELILEHFWISSTDTLTGKQRKRLWIAQYLAVALVAASQIYLGDRWAFKYEFELTGWPRYLPIPFLLYLGVVEPILEWVLKKELVLEHFWTMPTAALTDTQLKRMKRRWIIAYLGVLFFLVP